MPSLQLSYSPNYFSLEDIVLQDVRVSCKFEVGVPKLGIMLEHIYPELKMNSYNNVGFSWLQAFLISQQTVKI